MCNKLNKEISILGCGWLGLPLGKHLAEKGYEVKGSTTTQGRIEDLRSVGILPFQIKLDDFMEGIDSFLYSDVLVVCITSKDVFAMQQLISHIERSPLKKVLLISSTSVYINSNQMVNEEAPLNDSALVHIEKLFSSNDNFSTTILRFGGLFGFDRKPGNFIKRSEQLKNPEGFVNLIHRDDCIQIIEQIILQGVWGETFNACAGSHPTRKEFYTRQMLKLGKSPPVFKDSDKGSSKAVNSDKLESALNYSFKYSNLMNLNGS